MRLCRRAFFKGRPAPLLPNAGGLLIPFEGAPGGLLAAPAHLAQEPAGLGGGIPVAEAFVDQGHHAWQGPEGGGVAERFLRTALQVGRQLDAILRLEAGLASGASGMFEGRAAAPRPRRVPASRRLVAHAAGPSHLGLGTSLLEELGRLHPPPLQRGEVAFHTFGITHVVLDGDRVKAITILCKYQ